MGWGIEKFGGDNETASHTFLMLVITGVLTACTGEVKTHVMPNIDIKKYNTAYVDLLKQDEFNLGAAIMAHVADMGFAVKLTPLPQTLLGSDLLIKYDYYDGWDFRKHLKNFNIQFLDAKTGSVLLSSRYELVGIWRGEEYRINYTFNDIRVKLGYPPLNNFIEQKRLSGDMNE